MGRPPFEGDSVQVIFAKHERDPLPPSTRCAGIPADLDRLCMALLHRDPEARAGAEEVFEVLGGVPAVGAGPEYRPEMDPVFLVGRAVRGDYHVFH